MDEKKVCPGCGAARDAEAERRALRTCPVCGYHYRMEPLERIAYLADEGSFNETNTDMHSRNPLEMAGYEDKLEAARKATGIREAIVTGDCTVEGKPLLVGAMSFSFLGGSMGSVVGEKISRMMYRAIETRVPVLIFATSGGARMQEGVFSLLQMAKTSAVAAEMDQAGVPFFVILCDPTTGGVLASFASLADVIIAEPGALIGFAGPRVIEGTIRAKLPEGFQRAEFEMEKGFVDIIAKRSEQRTLVSKLIDFHAGSKTV
jgi:acetyl-CoA carboxylase carboxyl transferase subunit beta